MFFRFLFSSLTLFGTIGNTVAQDSTLSWFSIKNPEFTLHYTASDSTLVPLLTETLRFGVSENTAFFGHPYPKSFEVWCFPNRAALDRQWQQDWGDSTFQSACWMVASGVGHRLDLLSPRIWGTEACEHRVPLASPDSANTPRHTKALREFRQLITHELTHVYHGQYCQVPDFSGMDTLGWWVEGLATYVSGQLDSTRLYRVRALVQDGKAPAGLAEFWSGSNRYGLAGSVIAALDTRFGRAVLFQLLPFIKPEQLFEALKLDEEGVLKLWKEGVSSGLTGEVQLNPGPPIAH